MLLKTAAHLRTHALQDGENLRDRRDEGATATEYGLLVAIIATIVIVGITSFGGSLSIFMTELGRTVAGLPNA